MISDGNEVSAKVNFKDDTITFHSATVSIPFLRRALLLYDIEKRKGKEFGDFPQTKQKNVWPDTDGNFPS